MASGEFRIPSLDGIRALAALLVFASHMGLRDVIPGGFGVTIFFFLSGFLITTLLRREFQRTGDISLKKFYLRRAFRIWPPMYLVLLLLLLPVVSGQVHNDTTPAAYAAQFLQYTNYYVIHAGDAHLIPGAYPMWSLAVEEHFYLMFPLALLWLLRRHDVSRSAQFLLGVCGLVLVWRCVLVFGAGADELRTFLATDTRLDSILYGCVMGLWINPALDREAKPAGTAFWSVALAAAVAVLLFCFLYRDVQFRETFRYSLQGIALIPLFFCAIRYSHWWIFRWLNTPWMRGMGLISYTFYLIHITALALVDRLVQTPVLVQALLGFLLSVAFASLMYVLVEGPLARLRHRLHAS
jgi:peptidoglycan/LPS O-acetylase OafA/YrhL